MITPPCTDPIAAVEREQIGTFFAVDHPAAIEFVWTGANGRQAHAALARGLRALGIEADDVPGMGVIVRKGKMT